MKKSYVTLLLDVIALESSDVVTASGYTFKEQGISYGTIWGAGDSDDEN